MTALSHDPPRSADLSLLVPEALEGRLRDLIRGYVRARSAELAQSVVGHIEALCRHPDLRDPALVCAYRRLATHWRWLVAQQAVPVRPDPVGDPRTLDCRLAPAFPESTTGAPDHGAPWSTSRSSERRGP